MAATQHGNHWLAASWLTLGALGVVKNDCERTEIEYFVVVYFRAMPPPCCPTPALVACRCRPLPLRVVAPSTVYEYLMVLVGSTSQLRSIFYGKLRPAGAQTIWLLHFMLQMYATQQKTSILNNNHPTKNNTMVEPVAATAAWLWRISQPYPREPLRKG